MSVKRHHGEYPAPVVPIPGWMSGLELEWLYQQAKLHQVIVEVGSAYGRSSHALLTGNYESFGDQGKVYCVDCWPMHKKATKDEFDYSRKDTHRRSVFFQMCGYFPNLNIWEMESKKAAEAWKYNPWTGNMIFLDGGTQQIEKDLLAWAEYAEGGVLCGHDYSDEYPNVKKAVDVLCEDAKTAVVNPEGTSIWLVEFK